MNLFVLKFYKIKNRSKHTFQLTEQKRKKVITQPEITGANRLCFHLYIAASLRELKTGSDIRVSKNTRLIVLRWIIPGDLHTFPRALVCERVSRAISDY